MIKHIYKGIENGIVFTKYCYHLFDMHVSAEVPHKHSSVSYF